MHTLVQWATILSPIIAVLIAIWASRSSAKDTAKNLVALEESTNKQVESVKELTKIQIEITKLLLEKELWEANLRYNQTDQSIKTENNNHIAQYRASEINTSTLREIMMKDLEKNRVFSKEQIAVLKELISQVTELSKKVNEE